MLKPTLAIDAPEASAFEHARGLAASVRAGVEHGACRAQELDDRHDLPSEWGAGANLRTRTNGALRRSLRGSASGASHSEDPQRVKEGLHPRVRKERRLQRKDRAAAAAREKACALARISAQAESSRCVGPSTCSCARSPRSGFPSASSVSPPVG
jgi:hypothetical protein